MCPDMLRQGSRSRILRNRVARLVLEVGTVSEGLMRRFQNVGPKKA